MVSFPPFCIRETTLVTSCLISCIPNPSEKGPTLKEIDPFSEGENQFKFDIVSSPESVSIPLKLKTADILQLRYVCYFQARKISDLNA